MTGGSGSTIARAPPVRDNGRMSEASDEELLQQAWAVLENAHSPYSKMRVGAALRARDGRVFAGCNVENASFGLTICAERTAIGNAVAGGVKEFDSVAIVSDAGALLMPCGACRQVLSEFAPGLRVILAARNGERTEVSLDELLPRSFRPSDLDS